MSLATSVAAGPIAWGLCQTACNAAWVTCLAGTGFVAGTYMLTFPSVTLTSPQHVFSLYIAHNVGTFTEGAAIPAAVTGCSVVQGA